MKLSDVIKTLKCKQHNTCGFDGNREITHAFSCDLMSDALMMIRNADDEISSKAILVTGLVTNQSIRTAEMLDIQTVLIVRDKKPSQSVIDVACQSEITLLSCEYGMYSASGILYSKGIKGYESI